MLCPFGKGVQAPEGSRGATEEYYYVNVRVRTSALVTPVPSQGWREDRASLDTSFRGCRDVSDGRQ